MKLANFAKALTVAALIAFISHFVCNAVLNRRASEGALVIDWIGRPALKSQQDVGWLIDIEFGLREDGVVVWRKGQ